MNTVSHKHTPCSHSGAELGLGISWVQLSYSYQAWPSGLPLAIWWSPDSSHPPLHPCGHSPVLSILAQLLGSANSCSICVPISSAPPSL